MEKDNIAEKKTLKNELFQDIYKRISNALQDKVDNYKSKVNDQKSNYLKLVSYELQKIDNDITSVLEKEGKIRLENKMSISDKQDVKKESIKTREQIERVSHSLTLIKEFPTQVEKKKINDLLLIDGENFEDLFLKGVNLSEDTPANVVISDKCRQCKAKLVWGRDHYSCSNKCSFSDPCNTHYRYSCQDCKMKYCTQCAYPHDPNTCGCGNEMKLQTMSYHSCDLCRLSISGEAWRCASCDFDICLTCYEKLAKVQGKISTSEDKDNKESKDEVKIERKSSIAKSDRCK